MMDLKAISIYDLCLFLVGSDKITRMIDYVIVRYEDDFEILRATDHAFGLKSISFSLLCQSCFDSSLINSSLIHNSS